MKQKNNNSPQSPLRVQRKNKLSGLYVLSREFSEFSTHSGG